MRAAAARVEQLSGTLRTLRHSFQLFTTDVQQHMQELSDQLELVARLRFTKAPRPGPSEGQP